MQLTETLPVDKIRNLMQDEKPLLPDEILSFIYSNKLFKIFIPSALGGLQLSLPEAIHLLADCAYADGSFGWLVQIGSGGGYFTEFLSAEIARDFISKPEFVIAGSGFPGGQAISQNDGFLIKNGLWKYCSGSQYATLFTANCLVNDTDEVRAFAFEPSQVNIIPDWNSYGMQATSSNKMAVDNLFLDAKMSFSLEHLQNDYGFPVHRFPFMLFAEVVICASLHGCFRHLIGNADELADKSNLKSLRAEVVNANEIADEYWATFELLVSRSWEIAMQNELFENEKLTAELSGHIKKTTELLFNSASKLFFLGGMPVTYLHHPFNKTWRDFTTICQHSLLKS